MDSKFPADIYKFINLISDGFLRIGSNNNIILANNKICHLLGFDKVDELIGLDITNFLTVENFKKISNFNMNSCCLNQVKLTKRNGHTFIVDLEVSNVLGQCEDDFTDLVIKHIVKEKNEGKRLELLESLTKIRYKLRRVVYQGNDIGSLLEKICNILTEERGYNNAWIAIWDHNKMFKKVYGSGMGKDFTTIVNNLEKADIPECVEKTLNNKKCVITFDPAKNCKKCPLSGQYNESAAISSPILYEDYFFGVLVISLPRNLINDIDINMIEDISLDIGITLYKFESNNFKNRLIYSLNTLPQPIVQISREYRILYANSAFIDFFKRDKKDIINVKIEDFYGKIFFKTKIKPHIDQCFKGERIQFDLKINDLEDRSLWLHIVLNPIKNNEGYIDSIISNGFNISKNKEYEQKILENTTELIKKGEELELSRKKMALEIEQRRASENLLSTILDKMPGGLVIIDNNYQICKINKRLSEITGFSENELKGKLCDIICPKGSESKSCPIWEFNQQGFTAMDTAIKCKDGRKVPILKNSKRIILDNKEHIVETFLDISELKNIQNKLIESEKRYRTIFENNNTAMLLINPLNGQIIDANKGALAFYGYNWNQMTMKSIYDIDTLDKSEIDELFKIYESSPSYSREFSHKIADGSIRNVEAHVSKLLINNRKVLFIILHDITEKSRAELALKKSELKYSLLNETINEGVWIVDKNDNTTFINSMMAQMLGYEVEYMIGRSIFSFINNDWANIAKNCLKKHHSESKTIDLVFDNVDKIHIYCLVNISILMDDYGEYDGSLLGITDISTRIEEQKLLECNLKEKEQLVKELYHRTNNNMQLIMSINSLKAHLSKDIGLGLIVKDLNQRIKSISIANRLLYKGKNLSYINLKEYLQNLVNNIFLTWGKERDIKVSYDLQDVHILIDSAIPIGLICNEIILNSLKHAWPPNNGGTIVIKLRMEEDVISLDMMDDGIGFNCKSNLDGGYGLGLKLIQMLASSQLNGKLNFKCENGVAWHLKFKDNLYNNRLGAQI